MNGRRLIRGHSLEGARFGASAAPRDGYYQEGAGAWVYRYAGGLVTIELSPTSSTARRVAADSAAYRAIVLAIHSGKAQKINATDLRILRSRWKPSTAPPPRPYKGEPAGSTAVVHDHAHDPVPEARPVSEKSAPTFAFVKWGLMLTLGALGVWALAPTRRESAA